MGRDKSPKKDAKKGGAPADPSGLRAAGAKLAAEQAKLPISAEDETVERQEAELSTPINSTEVMHLSSMLARTQGQIDEAEAEIAAFEEAHRNALKEKKKALEKLRKEATKLAREVREEARFALVPVRVVKRYTAGQIDFYRLDRKGPGDEERGPEDRIGVLYDSKPMPPEEREKAIFGAVPGGERVVLDEDGDA